MEPEVVSRVLQRAPKRGGVSLRESIVSYKDGVKLEKDPMQCIDKKIYQESLKQVEGSIERLKLYLKSLGIEVTFVDSLNWENKDLYKGNILKALWLYGQAKKAYSEETSEDHTERLIFQRNPILVSYTQGHSIDWDKMVQEIEKDLKELKRPFSED